MRRWLQTLSVVCWWVSKTSARPWADTTSRRALSGQAGRTRWGDRRALPGVRPSPPNRFLQDAIRPQLGSTEFCSPSTLPDGPISRGDLRCPAWATPQPSLVVASPKPSFPMQLATQRGPHGALSSSRRRHRSGARCLVGVVVKEQLLLDSLLDRAPAAAAELVREDAAEEPTTSAATPRLTRAKPSRRLRPRLQRGRGATQPR
jgi:hypothetical protein